MVGQNFGNDRSTCWRATYSRLILATKDPFPHYVLTMMKDETPKSCQLSGLVKSEDDGAATGPKGSLDGVLSAPASGETLLEAAQSEALNLALSDDDDEEFKKRQVYLPSEEKEDLGYRPTPTSKETRGHPPHPMTQATCTEIPGAFAINGSRLPSSQERPNDFEESVLVTTASLVLPTEDAPVALEVETLTTRGTLGILWKDRRVRVGSLFCILGSVVITLMAAFGVQSFTSRGSGKFGADATVADSTTGPSTSPSQHQFLLPPDNEFVNFLLPQLSEDSRSALSAFESPQAKALQWTIGIDNDGFNMTRKVQRFALACLYFSLGGDKWNFKDNWISAEDECTEWYSSFDLSFGHDLYSKQKCNENGELRKLLLTNNGLEGELPVELNLLTNLRALFLNSNGKLVGSLSTSVDKMTHLEGVDLSYTSISGLIPSELGLLSMLSSLMLTSTRVKGRIPTQLGNVTSLQLLDLSHSFLSGSIPTELWNLKGLVTLDLSDNALEGTLPNELVIGLKGISELTLSKNGLTGPLPLSLGQLTGLKYLLVYDNEFSGTLPESLGNCTLMEGMSVARNLLTGTIPDSLIKLSSMTAFNVEGNNFTAPFPAELCKVLPADAVSAECRLECSCCLLC
jgi:hypothetical protein